MLPCIEMCQCNMNLCRACLFLKRRVSTLKGTRPAPLRKENMENIAYGSSLK